MEKEFLTLVITALGGGGLYKIFDIFISKRKVQTDEFQVLLDQYKQLYKDTLESEKRCNENYRAIEKEVSNLRYKVLLLESATHDMPFPMWFKDLDFTMLGLNKEYELQFLAPQGLTMNDYIGKTDTDIWGAEVAKEFIRHDREALNSKDKYWIGQETITLNNKDISPNWRIIKYVRYNGKIPIGIAGIAMPIFNSKIE